ncbi:MAG TPA: hypothetical protein VFV38_06575 [Ktedonobacteraceae bacterium]|nr:hypothetical protein [Ktedonobacteraceae bacterium]
MKPLISGWVLTDAAQLSLFLGQHDIPDEALDRVPRAKDEAGL